MASMANSTLIGTMNMLGGAYNPFEFPPPTAKFMNVCESFEARARASHVGRTSTPGARRINRGVRRRHRRPPDARHAQQKAWAGHGRQRAGG